MPTNSVAGSSTLPCQKKKNSASKAEPPFKVTLACSCRVCGDLKKGLEIVPPKNVNTTPYKDSCTISYTGPNPPDHIRVSGIGKIDGGGTYKVNCEIDPGKSFRNKTSKLSNSMEGSTELMALSAVDLFKRMWTYNSKIKHRVSGLPVSFPITIYNPEEYKITIDLPPTKSYSVGAKLSPDRKTTAYHEKSTKPGKKDGETTTTSIGTRIVTEDSSGGAKFDHKPEGAKEYSSYNPVKVGETEASKANNSFDAITITRSGAPLQIDGLNILSGILSSINFVLELMNLIKDAVPKVGWFIDFDVQVFQGSLSLQWAWKEFTDERAYYDVALNGTIKLVSAKIELGFGLKTKVVVAQAFADLTGEVPLTVDVNHHEPSLALKTAVGIAGVLTFTIGARGKVAYIVSIQISASAGIEAAGTFTADSSSTTGILLNFDFTFTGIKGTLTYSMFPGGGAGRTKSGGGSGKKEYTFMEPRLLGRYEWPSASVTTDLQNKEVSEHQFKNIIQRQCLDYIEFDEDSKLMNGPVKTNAQLRPVICNLITDKMFPEPILKTVKGVEGIASQLRVRLETLQVKEGRFTPNLVAYNELNDFINNYVPIVASQCHDPFKAYTNTP